MINFQKKKFLFLFLTVLFLATSNTSTAQENQKRIIDSILISIKKQDGVNKKKGYAAINSIAIKSKPELATELFKYALLKDSSELAKMIIYNSYTKNLSSRGFTDKALKLKLIALNLAKKLNDSHEEAYYHIVIAHSYNSMNMPDKALYHLNIAEPLTLAKENEGLLWNLYFIRAELQLILKDIKGAAYYNLKMWEQYKDLENTPQKRFVLYTLVDFFSQVDYPLEQAKFTELLAQHYEDAYPDMPPGHMPIKSIFEGRSNIENIARYKKVIEISDSLNSINSFLYTTFALSDIYRKLNRPDEAIIYLKNVERQLDTTHKQQQLVDLYTVLSNTNVEANNYKEAYHYKILEASLRDSITSEKMQKNIAELEVKFDTEKKEREIIEQKLIIETKTREKNQAIYLMIGLGLITILLILFFRNKLNYQKTIATQTEAIQHQEITDLHQRNKLLALNSMIEGQEAERLRIAKDLHDSLGGLLSTVKAHFTIIQKEIEQLEEFNLTQKTNNLIDEACLEVRRISHNMMPHALGISGLKGAIEDLGEQLGEQGFKTTVEVSNLPNNLDDTKKIMLYRLVQEIISNTRKHANAKTILIQLLGHKKEINLIIEDNGKGFNYDDALAKNGMGLKSINSRVEFLDGSIHWDSQENYGTTVTINIPVV